MKSIELQISYKIHKHFIFFRMYWKKLRKNLRACINVRARTHYHDNQGLVHLEHYASLFLYIYTVNFKCSSTAARRQAEDVKHDTFAGGDSPFPAEGDLYTISLTQSGD